jgi:hypothetical protein
MKTRPRGLRPETAWRSSRRQLGVVLPMSLILLVVITLAGVMAMRSSISTEAITNNLRSSSVAMQAAETALRYCETQLASGNTLTVNAVANDGDPILWKTRSNWTDTAITNLLPASVSASADGVAPRVAPRCLIETYRLRRGDPDDTQKDPVLITAIGYSPDAAIDGAGKVTAGGEVWLQSVLRLP